MDFCNNIIVLICLSFCCFNLPLLFQDILDCLIGRKIDPISSFEVIEWVQFGLTIKNLVFESVVPKGIVNFILESKLYFEFREFALCVRIIE